MQTTPVTSQDEFAAPTRCRARARCRYVLVGYLLVYLALDALVAMIFRDLGHRLWVPPAAMLVGFVWLCGPRALPVAWLGVALGGVWHWDAPLGLVLVQATVLTAGFGAMGIAARARGFDARLGTVRDVLTFGAALLLAALLLTLALLGVQTLWGIHGWSLAPWVLPGMWLSTALGGFIVAPLMLTLLAPWCGRTAVPAPLRLHGRELLPWAAAVGALCVLPTLQAWAPPQVFFPLWFVPLLWAVLRAGQRGGLLVVAFFAVSTLLLAAPGPALLEDLRLFLPTFAVAALLLSAMVEELALADRRHRLLFAGAHDAMLLLDGAGHILDVNARMEALSGYARAELRALPPVMLTTPEQLATVYAAFAALPMGGGMTDTSVLRRRDGRAVPVEFSGTRLSADLYMLALRDVSAQHAAEAAHRASEARLSALLHAMSDVAIFKDRAGRWREANTAALRLLDLEGLEYRGKSDAELAALRPFCAAALGVMAADDAAVWADGVPRTARLSLPMDNGFLLSMHISKTPLIDDADAPDGLLVIGRDLSDLDYQRVYVHQQFRALQHAIQHAPVPMLLLDVPSGVVRQESTTMRDLLALPRGRNWWDLRLFTPVTRMEIPHAAWPVARAMRGEEPPPLEALAQLPDGRELPVLMQAAPVEVDGEILRVVMTLQDITALKATDRAKNEFLALASHEMMTPLTSILGWAIEAEDDAALAPRAIAVILRNARRQQRLLNELLDTTRLLHGLLTCTPVRMDLRHTAAEGADELGYLAEDHGIHLVLEEAPAPLFIYGDPARLRQVLDNLLTNAFKFTPPDGAVTVTTRRAGDQVQLIVRDTGRGIPPEELATVFAPFRQIHRDETLGGLGLGLTLAQGIIAQHGGAITVDSPGPGHGSTFTVTLPLAEG